MVAPCKSIAIAQFESEMYAKNAFKHLSYYEYKHEPLYLEWAPEGFFQEETNKAQIIQEEIIQEEDNDSGSNNRMLFVKNLNFDTSQQDLKKAFEENCQGIRSVKVASKNNLSCGFGFIEFENESMVKQALKKMQNFMLDGHILKVSISKSQEQQKDSKKKNTLKEAPSNKIIVRNIAFEANKDDIVNIFKNFGETKTVRLPKKMDNNHRGFAFVEFVSIEEAKNAFQSLQNTHLYGRKLNLEWAKKERSADDLVVLN